MRFALGSALLRFISLTGIVLFSGGITATCRGASIGFVVDPAQDGQTIPTLDQSFDIFWVERLRSQGHNVSVLGANWSPTEPGAVAADIFIVSNDVGSGDFISTPGNDRLFDLNPVDLTGQNSVEVTVAMAARSTGWDIGIDFVKFLADGDGDGVYETELGDFQPTDLGDLGLVNGNAFLHETFQDVTFSVPNNLDTLRLRIEPFSTAPGEQFGFDNIRVSSGNSLLGSENFEGGADQIGYSVVGQAVGNPNQFWGLSSADGVEPEVVFTGFEGDVWFGGADLDEDFGFGANVRLNDGRPLITYEDALFDELQLGADPATGRNGDNTYIIVEDPSHPLAAGLTGNALGEVDIFDAPQGITFLGVAPDDLGPDVHVVATNADGAAVIAVLEKDGIGFDGNPSPGMRIGFFPQDAGDGTLYNENGLALLDAAVAFALDNAIEPPAGIPGDYSGNGTVEQADLDLVLLNWGEAADPIPGGWINDLPEGTIDQNELDGVLLNWGNSATLANVAGVPEPASCVILLIIAASALVTRGGRRST